MITVFGSKTGNEELREIQSSLENQWMGVGPKTKKFEEDFAQRLRLPNFTLVNSGSNALLLAVKTLDLPPGSEIIVPSFTWISCAHAVALEGHKPVFCDVDLDTHNITSQTAEPHITSKTEAIMVVHYAGKPVRMDALKDLGFPIIEDAAHAVDSKIGDRYCGSLGDVGIYSFDAVKNLAMPTGGGITGKNPKPSEQATLLRNSGIEKTGFMAAQSKPSRWWEYNVVDYFPDMKPNDICASVGLAQMKKLDECQAYRKKIWDTFQEEFANLGWLIIPKGPEPDEQHSYFTYCIRLMSGDRDRLARHLFEKKIFTTLNFYPLHMYAIYKSDSKLLNCELLNETALNLPLHPNLSESDIAYIIESVRQFNP